MVNIGDINLTFLDEIGSPLKEGEVGIINRWVAKINNIESYLIKSIKFPTLSYESTGPLMLEVELYERDYSKGN